ncbi:MAG: amino acid ABC transporter permease [Hyphomicrobiaceae bacterium]|nr:amino acid ABC transporter permease [Hyphomicrobiaceae bacterium]
MKEPANIEPARSTARRPPVRGFDPLGWVRRNLFSSPLNGLLTLAGIYAVWLAGSAVIDWAIVRAVFAGKDGSACAAPGTGACWAFVAAKFDQFIYGRYPEPERLRVDLTMLLGVIGLAGLMIPAVPRKGWFAAYFLFVFPVIAFYLLTGAGFGMVPVETERWGGLMVTLIVAIVGIVASFPVAVLLAIGRRSRLPFVRWASIGFIEMVRGVPLITMLFMASVMLPLFLPDGVTFDKLLRALIGVALFQGAYLAEVIRGGLQAIPRGQYEAADALGLSYPQKIGLIVMPQALKLVIPGIVNSFIALFKDTSLVLIIGLFDLLGIVQQAVSSDAAWFSPSTPLTGYVFAGFVFWVFCFGMSRYAQWMERRLSGGERR